MSAINDLGDLELKRMSFYPLMKSPFFITNLKILGNLLIAILYGCQHNKFCNVINTNQASSIFNKK